MALVDCNPGAASSEERITLEAYEIDGLFGDAELTRIVEFAGQLCHCPIALVSLVEEHRQRFVARTGIDATESPRSMSFCAYAMLGHDVMEVSNAAQDPRFRHNPLVTGEPHIRFYAGAPLLSKSGEALGSLCVISPDPRAGLTDLQRQGLSVLAEATMRRLEARRVMLAHRAWEDAAEADLAASEERFRVLADAMPQMVWSTRADGYHDYYNARWYDYTGAQVGKTDGTGWNGQFHPDDQARAWEVWSHSLATGNPYEIEYRLRRFDGEYRWTLGRALPIRDDAGNIVRWFGTCTDIHDQRLMREQKELLSRELVHRIKNIFTVIGSLLYLSSRGVPELSGFSAKMGDQIAALGRAYDYVQPREGAQALTLQGLLRELFAAYNLEGIERIRIRGDDVLLAETYMTPIALVFHELATNAVKYGSLSTSEGFVDLMISGSAEQLTMEWQESKGESTPPSDHQGFGSDLIRLSIERQLRGTFVREWSPRGLKVTTTIPYRMQAA